MLVFLALDQFYQLQLVKPIRPRFLRHLKQGGEFDTDFYVAIIFIYTKHITAVGVCVSQLRQILLDSVIYLQQRHEM